MAPCMRTMLLCPARKMSNTKNACKSIQTGEHGVEPHTYRLCTASPAASTGRGAGLVTPANRRHAAAAHHT
jgi:hypothetical protein